jgi:hypothetical protein
MEYFVEIIIIVCVLEKDDYVLLSNFRKAKAGKM